MALHGHFRLALALAALLVALVGGVDSLSMRPTLVPSATAAQVVIQRTTIYVSTLPKGCVKTEYNGGEVVVWKCGSLYYQPYKGRYVRVYIR